MKRLIWLRGSPLGGSAAYETVTGAIVNFTTQRSAPLKSLLVSMSPVQAAGTPSPDNPLPISGWSSLAVEQRGKNLLNINSPDITLKRYTAFSNGVISNEIEDTRTAPWTFIINAYDSNGTSILQKSTPFSATGRISIPLTIPANAVSMLCRYSGSKLDCGFTMPIDITGDCVFSADILSADVTTIGGLQIGNFQLELGSTASSYTPYNTASRSISVTFPAEVGTVYSGTLDVVSGVLTVDYVKFTANGTEYWMNGSAANNYRWGVQADLSPSAEVVTSDAGAKKSKSDKFVASYTVWSDGQNVVGFICRGTKLYVRFGADTDLTTGAAVKAWFAENPTEFVYPLATPLTYQLTPQEVLALVGENNVWSNADSVTVEYRSN